MGQMRISSLLAMLTLTFFPCLAAWAAEPVDFTHDIRPLLSNKCFQCHGPDEAERHGGLRLDTQDGAHGSGDSTLQAIVPGEADSSEVLRRVLSDDEAERMPPPGSGKPLTADEVAKLKAWINQGANYAGHWAYQPPQRSELPEVHNSDWPVNAVDRFILARLEREGLQPQPEADRTTLIRRLSLDLTGLPPTVEEVDRFVNDASPEAYEQLVDRLLAQPGYGEHWARMWLDLARYADSTGYANDLPRDIWAFRDYVIRSLNDNKPFDQFTIEQLAGDLLPNPTDEQLIATAFHRNTLTNNEGGTSDEEFRNAAIVDRVNTTFAVWMGTTMACAQCHTHKFDPITQHEYFQVFAVFNNTADADRRDESPKFDVYTDAQKQQKQDWQQELEELKRKLSTPTPELVASYQRWLDRLHLPLQTMESSSVDVDGEKTADSKTQELVLQPASDKQFFTGLRLHVPAAATGTLPAIKRVSASIEDGSSSSPAVKFVRISIPGKQKMLSLAEVQVFSGGQNVAPAGAAKQSSTDFGGPAKLAIDGNTDGDYQKAKSTTHTAVSKDPWWELELSDELPVEEIRLWNRTDGNLHVRLKDFVIEAFDAERKLVWQKNVSEPPNPDQSFALRTARPIPWLAAFADQTAKEHNAADVINGPKGWKPNKTDSPAELTLVSQESFALKDGERLRLRLEWAGEVPSANAAPEIQFVTDSRAREFGRLPEAMRQLVTRPAAERNESEETRLRSYFLAEQAPELKTERQRKQQVEKSLAAIKPTTTVPFMQQLPEDKQRTTHVQLRGNFMSLGDEVQAGLPEAFFEWQAAQADDDDNIDRLDLARWLVAEENPLTARVIANRYWEKLFGIGLVATSEEFGSQGELPSHPELLDWLATELHRLDWDLKAFVRTLVLSRTYRQASTVDEALLARDPQNRLLARGPRFRLTAEMVRDQALAAGGLLSNKMYGPPVRPPQPKLNLKAAFSGGIDWETSDGEDRYRRGIYTRWQRTNPYPSMMAFDAPDRSTCVVRRDRTNTPLQAFVTLNDPVYVEAAQSLGRRMAGQAGELTEQIRFGFRATLVREPRSAELDRLVELWEQTRQQYASQPEAATQLATDPIGPLPEGSDPAEMAAWTLVGNVLLNLDETLMKP